MMVMSSGNFLLGRTIEVEHTSIPSKNTHQIRNFITDMAKAVTLKNNNNEEVYPVTDISLVNGELNGARIVNASVGSDKLTPNAVWEENIKDKAVTSAKIDFATLYKSATPLSATLPVQTNTETTVQSFSLPAGKWRIFWAVRGYGGENAQTDIIYTGLKANGNKVQSLAVNCAVVGGAWRPYISCSYEANITSSTTFSTYITMPMAGNISAETTYLFALRVG